MNARLEEMFYLALPVLQLTFAIVTLPVLLATVVYLALRANTADHDITFID